MGRVVQNLSFLFFFELNFSPCGAGALRGRRRKANTTSYLAAVYSDTAADGGSQHVEMMRFVTPYGTGMETMVDVTQYSTLLRSGELSFFNFIDTWVGNDTSAGSYMYLDNVTGECSSQTVHGNGNGWVVQADLVFWQSPDVEPVQPRATIFLATGQAGAQFPIGTIGFQEGTLFRNGSITLKQGVDPHSATNSHVYRCPGGAAGLKLGRVLGLLQHVTELASRYNRSWDRVESLANNIFSSLAYSSMVLIEAFALDDDLTDMSVLKGHYDSDADVRQGMPVFYTPGSLITDVLVGEDVWMNFSYPFEPIGRVLYAENGTMLLSLNVSCMPAYNGSNSSGPGLMVPNSPHVLERITTLINQTRMTGRALSLDSSRPAFAEGELHPEILSLSDHTLQPVEVLGNVFVTGSPLSSAPPEGSGLAGRPALTYFGLNPVSDAANANASEHVCLVTRSPTGRFLDRTYELPELADGEAVVLQLMVTGHGWDKTTEQCGEFCHAVYRLRLNGRSAANVTQWRDDCHLNPTGEAQHGTWEESRNGWCPGSVEPGVFINVTDYVRSGANAATLDLVVWSNVTGSYEPYANPGGFAYDDGASLAVSLALFVYEPRVVAAVRNHTFRPYSLAEKAIKHGCSHPEALQPPDVPTRFMPVSFLARDREVTSFLSMPEAWDPRAAPVLATSPLFLGYHRQRKAAVAHLQQRTEQVHRHYKATVDSSGRFDFDGRAPWYLYNETLEGGGGGVRMTIFEGSLSQGSSREITATVPAGLLPRNWSQVALHFRLKKPPGDLSFDAWDRKGSFGMLLSGSSDLRLVGLKPPLRVSTVDAMPRFDGV